MFEKLSADIPDCCRIDYDVDDLNAAHYLSQLPQAFTNSHKNPERKKWMLVRERTNEVMPEYENWPELIAFLGKFPGKIYRAHISLMEPRGVLRIHQDGLNKKTGDRRPLFDEFNMTLRFHVPLATTPNAWIYSAGKFYSMKEGECWMLNNFKDHSALNTDAQSGRYHLIFDVVPTADTLALLDTSETDLGEAKPDYLNRYWDEVGEQLNVGQNARRG